MLVPFVFLCSGSRPSPETCLDVSQPCCDPRCLSLAHFPAPLGTRRAGRSSCPWNGCHFLNQLKSKQATHKSIGEICSECVKPYRFLQTVLRMDHKVGLGWADPSGLHKCDFLCLHKNKMTAGCHSPRTQDLILRVQSYHCCHFIEPPHKEACK